MYFFLKKGKNFRSYLKIFEGKKYLSCQRHCTWNFLLARHCVFIQVWRKSLSEFKTLLLQIALKRANPNPSHSQNLYLIFNFFKNQNKGFLLFAGVFHSLGEFVAIPSSTDSCQNQTWKISFPSNDFFFLVHCIIVFCQLR